MLSQLPPNVTKYSESPVFDQSTVPDKLKSAHKTKESVWGKVIVRSGALEFVIPGPPKQSVVVEAGQSAIIEPAVEHHVSMIGEVTFQIEFYRSL